ncbi:hypothetical protein SAQ01S_07050 [Sphingomonas aquatilis NBRC 16722]|uniref:VP2 n=1 Tax=Sphingomonas aquatilis TaxID=93063 RepID=A0AAW3TU83_9SPHN|nr:hypothetical protein [Sphingomonas aquatilis]MBB3876087.1 hypothetical protein [Sphingomonas aquatilis]GEM70939.1 hypothetical protein SAQ01S_07050 [Sphingomonas aquatilis NBRC 16722]
MGMMFRGFAGDETLPAMASTQTGMATPQLARPKPGFFDRGGMGLNLLGGIADAVASAYGAAPTFAPVQQQYRQRQQMLSDWRMKQDAESAQWLAQEQWKRAHPAPVNNDTVNDYNFIADKLGPDAANQYLRNLGDPTVTVPLGQDRIYAGPRSGLGAAIQGSAGVPRPAIGSVVADPRKGGTGSGQSSFRAPNRF